MSRELVIVGGGGLAAEVFWAASAHNAVCKGSETREVIGFFDSLAAPGYQNSFNIPILRTIDQVRAASKQRNPIQFCVGIGNNQIRRRVAKEMEEAGFVPATIIHPSAIFGPETQIGIGTLVAAGAVVAPRAHVGNHTLINAQCTVGHDCRLGSFVNICPGVRIGGHAIIEDGALIGSNAVIHPGRTVGAGATVGASSYLIRSLKPGMSAIGVPAIAMGKSQSD